MSYQISFKESARKELLALPKKAVSKIVPAIDGLADEPRPVGVKKLKGQGENLYRIRVGNYRVIYLIDDAIQIVNIRRVADRKEVYD